MNKNLTALGVVAGSSFTGAGTPVFAAAGPGPVASSAAHPERSMTPDERQ